MSHCHICDIVLEYRYFRKGDEQMPKKNTYKTKSVPETKKAFHRGTYYLTPDLIRRLKIRAIEEGKDFSEVVRDALEAHLSKGSSR